MELRYGTHAEKYQLRAITDTEKKHVRIERNTLFSPSQATPGTTSLQEKTAEKSANMPQPAHARTTWTLARGTLLRAGLEQWVKRRSLSGRWHLAAGLAEPRTQLQHRCAAAFHRRVPPRAQ